MSPRDRCPHGEESLITTPTQAADMCDGMANRLLQAFQLFNEKASQLKRSYRRLGKRLHKHNRELVRGNQQLEEHLKQAAAVGTFLRNTLDSLPMGVIVANDGGNIILLNREAEDMTQSSPEAAAGLSIEALLSTAFHPFTCLRSPLARRGRFEQVVLQDEWPLHLRLAPVPLQGTTGERVGSVVIVEDVTRLTRWQEQVQRTNRLDALGEMAVSIAQEVRNALGSMELFASLLKQELEHEAEKAMLAEHILSGVKSLNQTISNLLAFTRCPIPCSTSVDPHRVLEESLIFASQLVRHHHLSLQKSFGADGVTIAADAALLKQVFLNLLLNAIQAMPTGGTLTLATRLHRDALEVRVSDTGLGIPPEVIEKIFNPFFTTKERGTGLGLTVVHNIMAAHKGIVHVVSMPGQGTTVTLSFPLEPAAAGLSPWASEGSDLEDRSLRHVDCGVDSTVK